MQKGRAKPPKATSKPYTRHILGIDSGVQSHTKATSRLHQGSTKATPKPHQSHTKATPKPYTRHILGIDSGVQSHTKATSRLHQGSTKATPKPHQSHTKATPNPPSCDPQARYKPPRFPTPPLSCPTRSRLSNRRLLARVFALAFRVSDHLGHHERLPVFAREHLIGLGVVYEALSLRVHLQDRAQRGRRLLEINIVGRQVLFHATEALGQVLVALHGLANFFGRLGLAAPVGDVARVAQRAGQVALQDVGVQVAWLAAAHRVNEVGEVAGGARELLNLGAVLVPNLRAGVIRYYHGASLAIHDEANLYTVILVHALGIGARRQSANLD